MNRLDSITLRAFLQALAEQETPLPDPAQQTLHQMAERLNTQQAETLSSLRALVAANPELEQPYNVAYREWQRRYQAQERAKYLDTMATGFSDFDLEQFVVQVFNAEDSTVTAKHILHRLNRQTRQQSTFWERSDRVMAMASGGAALGAMIGQIPGALVGAGLGATYGWFSGAKSQSIKAPE